MPTIDAEEKRWMAENDARTLAEAKEIQQDKARMDAARVAAKEMAEKEQKRLAAMRSVAGRNTERKGSAANPTPNRSERSSNVIQRTNSHNVFKKI